MIETWEELEQACAELGTSIEEILISGSLPWESDE